MITVEKAQQILANPEGFAAGDPGEAISVLAREIVRRGTRRRRLFAVVIVITDETHKYIVAARSAEHAKSRVRSLGYGVEPQSVTEIRNPFLTGTSPLEAPATPA